MSWPGSNTRGRSLQPLAKWVILSLIALVIYIFLKKKITLTKGTDVYNLLLKNGLRTDLAKYATAQAAHETGGFTSFLFMFNNNCFGMKYAGQANAVGMKNGYAYYNSIDQSTLDFIDWFNDHRNFFQMIPNLDSLETWVHWLKLNSYFEASEQEYLRGCKSFYKQIFG